MLLLALKMLIGDRAKYISIVLGLSFASFIISWQAAILVGITKRTYGILSDTTQVNIWVVDPTVQYIDDIKPLKDTDLYAVRSIEGVDFAVPLFKGTNSARLKNGTFQTCVILGIDDATLIGAPPVMLEGKVEDLRQDGAVIANIAGVQGKLASPSPTDPNVWVPMQVGDTMELNDHYATVVGICDVSRTFQSQPVLYMTYEQATAFAPHQRKLLSFILVQSAPGIAPQEVCDRIHAATGLAAYTVPQLEKLTLVYYMKYTGIFINFGTAILLGFIIGTAIAGQTLYNFTMDNLPFFAIFKAMGADNILLVKMVLLQALFVSAIGWGIGLGAASFFGYSMRHTELSFNLPLPLYFATAVSILCICLFAATICMKKVVKVDPAIVFKS